MIKRNNYVTHTYAFDRLLSYANYNGACNVVSPILATLLNIYLVYLACMCGYNALLRPCKIIVWTSRALLNRISNIVNT